MPLARRRLSSTALVAVLAALVGHVPAAAAADGSPSSAEVVGVELVAHPDQAHLGRRGMVSIVAEAAAGSVVEREVEVSNDTRRRQRLTVSVGGATVGDEGFLPDDADRLVTSWSAVEPAAVELVPGGRERVRVRIAVPADAPDGEHLAVVWVQPPASEGAIREVNRVGVRVYLTTTGGTPSADATTAPADFLIEGMVPRRLADGTPQVVARVRNTGGRTLDLVGELGLADGPGGVRAGPFPTDAVTTLGVGRVGEVLVTLPADLPAGPWLARLLLASGDVERAAEARIAFPSGAGAEADEVPAEMTPVERQRRVLIPIASTLLVTILVILAVLWWGWRRARRDEDDEPSDHERSDPETDDAARQSSRHRGAYPR